LHFLAILNKASIRNAQFCNKFMDVARADLVDFRFLLSLLIPDGLPSH
jgi:hypothetical protein